MTDYQVDSIVGRKVKGGRVYYKVHWKGYSSKDDSWEPSKALLRCQVMIDEYNESQKKAALKAVLLSSDDDDAPSARTRSKTGSSKTSSRQPRSPRMRANEDAATQRRKAGPPVAVTPQVSAPPYNLRHTIPHPSHNPMVMTSPQTYSTPQDLRRHVLNQQRHHVTLTPATTSSTSSYLFQRSTLSQQNKPVAREVFSTSVLSSDEESELDLSARPSKDLARKHLRSSTKAPLTPPQEVHTPTKPAKVTPTQKSRKGRKQVVSEKPKLDRKADAMAANGYPGWMQLGWAEFFLALVIVAIITLSLWLYQTKAQDESTPQ